MSEAVLDGAALDVTLGTGDVVRLTAATNGTTLSGTYTVSAGDSSDDLSISSFEVVKALVIFMETHLQILVCQRMET